VKPENAFEPRPWGWLGWALTKPDYAASDPY
jgi:hypothetical protein